MGFACVNGVSECNGCMSCQSETERHYYCPICGEEFYETVFVSDGGEVIGCENCAEIKEPHEVFDDEDY